MPTVSCILPVNKDDGFLTDAVNSILVQTYQDFELIIVANNCSDNVWRTVQSFKDPRVIPIRCSIGQLPFALNLGIEKSQGKYIARMDADDIANPQRFAKQVSYLEEHQECDILGTNLEAINAQGEPVQYIRKFYQTDEDIKRKLPISTPLYHPTVMFKKDFILEVRGYAYEFYAEDYDLWLRARRLKKYHFYNLNEKLLKYRIHEHQATSSQNKRMPFISEISLRYREFLLTKEFLFLWGIFGASKLGRFMIKIKNVLKGNIVK